MFNEQPNQINDIPEHNSPVLGVESRVAPKFSLIAFAVVARFATVTLVTWEEGALKLKPG